MKKKLKLKGKLSESIPKDKKKKMQRTLDKIQKVREEDSYYLRDLANAKLKWAIEERKKGLERIETLKEDMQKTVQRVTKLTGAIAVLGELLQPKSPEK